jgi:nicotinate-nucleotide pyrophosphorylase (carboxylating)
MIHTEIDQLITRAIAEDIIDPRGIIPSGDHTSLACFPNPKPSRAKLLVKDQGILAGVEIARLICQKIDSELSMEVLLGDGVQVAHGDIAFYLHGEEKSILRAERLLLNCMQRMSGIATTTALYVAAIAGTRARVLDTRKTTPGLRAIEKQAVVIGGGHNHRMGLYDMIMLKDNHIDYCGGIPRAINAVKTYQETNGLKLPVEIETRSLADVEQVIKIGGVNRIMFDNFTVTDVSQALKMVAGKYETEVSGGITLATIRPYAEAGPDYISVGALTHYVRSLDLSLKAD